jgi:hypothetical protein
METESHRHITEFSHLYPEQNSIISMDGVTATQKSILLSSKFDRYSLKSKTIKNVIRQGQGIL